MERKPSFSSSSCSSPPAKRFDVFLSFRGEDTRNNFTSHLSLALRKIGLFSIFKDDYALDKGKEIAPELMNAIEHSHYAVVVLSENYATSSWCLRELAKIVECMGDSGRIQTIFYHVNPSHVRNVNSSDVKKQEESSFWKALEEHAKNPSNSEYLESWRNALVKVANQSGHPVEDFTNEAIFIEEFIAKISRELGASIRTTEGLYGMTSRLKKLDSYVLQSSATNTVCFIGIHGMGGVGKSTLARAYYKRMSHKLIFEGRCSFLESVREVCERKENGLVYLQNLLLSDILKKDLPKVGHIDDGIDMIRSRLRDKTVLIVLDDVSKLDQLNGLAGENNWFGSGSIILITTREESFLKIKRYTIYRAEYLNPCEALQLFSSKAFRSIGPPEEYKKLSQQVVEYAGYLPLALTVLGSLLGSKKTSEWESALRRLRRCPEKEIIEKLQISFDDLNETDQRIFLDIACFFIGFDKDKVIQILDCCDFDSEYGISNLIDKSLLSIQNDWKLCMHDLLQEMGKEIVRKKSGYELRRQSRIWDTVDLYHILENIEATNHNVEAIVTSLDKTMKFSFEGFLHLKKLRLLMILGYRNFLPERDGSKLDQYLPNDLRFLQYRNSNIEQLWNNRVKPLYTLKVIDLSNSAYFIKFEDFSVVPNLERLILKRCSKLSEIHPSIKDLKRLKLLNLKFCASLEKFPKEMNGLASLEILNLYGCLKLCKLPDNLEQLKCLRKLDIRMTGITHLPSSIFTMENLKLLAHEEMVESAVRENIINPTIGKYCFLPGSFDTSLTKLDLIDCNLSGEAFPEYFGELVCLQYLDLSKNPFSVLPTGIKGLSSLKSLRLESCERLRCLEAELLPSSLEVIYVNYCTSLSSFLNLSKPCHIGCSAFCLDCTELVKRQDGKTVALAFLKRFLEGPYKERPWFEIVVPQSGHELPAWFIKQSSTSSISIKLDPNWHNSKLIGFAMVFCFGGKPLGNYFLFKLRVGCSKKWKTIFVEYIKSRRSDHLFLCYMHRGVLPSSCDNLEFSFYAKKKVDACSCQRCGVRLVYEEDIEELNKITSKYNNASPHSKSGRLSKLIRNLDLKEDFELVDKQDSNNTTSTISSERSYVQDHQPNPESKIDIVIPGSKFPAWFEKHSLEPTLSTKLYPNWCNSEWMGFALSVCVRSNSSSDNFYCVISFLGDNLKVSKESITKGGSSENIWLLYLTRDYFPTTWLNNSFGNIEFSFHAQTFNDEDSCCGQCGVRLIYEKDKEKLYQTIERVCIGPPDREDDQSSPSNRIPTREERS